MNLSLLLTQITMISFEKDWEVLERLMLIEILLCEIIHYKNKGDLLRNFCDEHMTVGNIVSTDNLSRRKLQHFSF